MRSSGLQVATLAISLLAGVSTSAFAGPVVTGYTGGSGYGIYYSDSTGDVVGFRFTADRALAVTKLGILVDPVDETLASPHQVGIWRNADQVLLGSVSVTPTGGQLIDGFLYEDLGAPISLSAGMEYTLGAMYAATDGDAYISSLDTLATSGISLITGAYPAAGSLGFVYPVLNGGVGRLGPNAFVRPVDVIPVPASIILVGLGTGLVAGFRRRVGSN